MPTHKKLKHYRKIVVDGETWQYRIGKSGGCKMYSPSGKGYYASASKLTGRSPGCYSSFNLQPDVEVLPDEPLDDDPQLKWKRAKKNNIVMAYYWDSDGTLVFTFEDGSQLTNTDCKKDHNWEYFLSDP